MTSCSTCSSVIGGPREGPPLALTGSTGRFTRPGRMDRCQLPSWIHVAPQEPHEACGLEFSTTVTVAPSQTGQRTNRTLLPRADEAYLVRSIPHKLGRSKG